MLKANERQEITTLFEEFCRQYGYEPTVEQFIWYLAFFDIIDTDKTIKFINNIKEEYNNE